MAGYNGTVSATLTVTPGVISVQTQSALSYIAGQRINLAYAQNVMIYMQGSVIAYSAITGSMTINIDTVSGIYSLQPPWGTEPWGDTNVSFSPWNLSLVGTVPAVTTQAAPQITVRTLSTAAWDPQRGQGLQNFSTDINAVSQIIATRLKLLEQEWFENTSLGTPLFQSLLGNSITTDAVALLLRQRILGTPFVTGIASFNISYTAVRTFVFSAVVQTAFGQITVSNQV